MTEKLTIELPTTIRKRLDELAFLHEIEAQHLAAAMIVQGLALAAAAHAACPDLAMGKQPKTMEEFLSKNIH